MVLKRGVICVRGHHVDMSQQLCYLTKKSDSIGLCLNSEKETPKRFAFAVLFSTLLIR